MTREQIYHAIRALAKVRPFYKELLECIWDDAEDKILSELEKQDFKDSVDLILYLEG